MRQTQHLPYVVNITGRIGRSTELEYELLAGARPSLRCGPLDEEVMLISELALFTLEHEKLNCRI